MSGSNYSPFHPHLDQLCPVKELLNEKNRQAVINDCVSPDVWISIFSRSPLNNVESELVMGKFVVAAVQAGQWVDIPLPFDYKLAIEIMSKTGFAIIKKESLDKQWFSPTLKLVNFVTKRLEN